MAMRSPLLFFEVENDCQHVKPNSVNCLQVEPFLDNFIFYALPCVQPCTTKALNEYLLDCWMNKETPFFLTYNEGEPVLWKQSHHCENL